MRSMSFQDLFVKSAEPARLPPATSLLSPSSAFDGLSSYDVAAAPDTTPKGSIDFILDDASHAAVKVELSTVPGAEQASQELRLATPTSVSSKRCLQDAEAAAPTPKRKKRKARICKEPGCDKYVVDHGLCIRHGGGKRCNVEGCNCRAQNRGLCWKHGGYTICKVDGCAKRAKSRGICWSHGGGTRCKTDGCSKIAVSLGRCWAHGGGKRCSIETCRKPASERTNNFCTDHYAWYGLQEEAAVAEQRQPLAQPTQ
ncbi:hypothetical protein PF005_g13138 [Phytophthora fragariae]|uniref:WRKY19-like zinc finger domain-containing protein n=2 Tax=Phytophthora TaxID=4783 RepID=A0A6A3XZX1_9STRA|nr:hypothetical protein PF003_g24573 [Phytophthora fragariae]KAE9022329.1 hypothetical protein PR002_g11994 [Phytophthora rubi]KAE8935751.1 hypothetical protein PF009_g14303 [Phytophthora fragariae]KAE9005575.1 hypothetical protein PF011_g11976 [Phytophthora fragariae]KAE9028686.1 hypothetical protein PR001_g11674 [Phytophthora rubi]